MNHYLPGDNTTGKVADVFSAAGFAFSKLGELALQLHPTTDARAGGKWTDTEVKMLQQAVRKFSQELSGIANDINKNRIAENREPVRKQQLDDDDLLEELQRNMLNPDLTSDTSMIPDSDILSKSLEDGVHDDFKPFGDDRLEYKNNEVLEFKNEDNEIIL